MPASVLNNSHIPCYALLIVKNQAQSSDAYKEENADQEKRFTLVVRQKKDRLADIVVE